MFRAILASLLFGSTTTVCVVEFQKWNQLDIDGSGAGSTSSSSTSLVERVLEGETYFEAPDDGSRIKYLRLEIDPLNQVRVRREENISGDWSPRVLSSGHRLYYEVISKDGDILARGTRTDPRPKEVSSNPTAISFVLSVPYCPGGERIDLYAVRYDGPGVEGEDGYRYSLLLSYPFQKSL